MKDQEKETEKCIGCEKQIDVEKISYDSGEPMCEPCEAEFHAEIKKQGVDSLDEYLKARGLTQDFNIFCQAKFSSLTEEEICETNENIDEPYQRWHLQDLFQTKAPQ